VGLRPRTGQASSPAATGADPTATSVPTATPARSTPAKKATWYSATQAAAARTTGRRQSRHPPPEPPPGAGPSPGRLDQHGEHQTAQQQPHGPDARRRGPRRAEGLRGAGRTEQRRGDEGGGHPAPRPVRAGSVGPGGRGFRPAGRQGTGRRRETDRFGLVTADGADRAPGALAELADFADADWVPPPAGTHYGEAIRSACRLAGFEPRAAHELLDTVATLTLASRGAGLAPATPMMLGLVPGLPLRVVELAQQLRRDVVLIRREADAHRDKVAAVTATVRAVVQACPNTRPTTLQTAHP
jgi:LysR substrate binding domain